MEHFFKDLNENVKIVFGYNVDFTLRIEKSISLKDSNTYEEGKGYEKWITQIV